MITHAEFIRACLEVIADCAPEVAPEARVALRRLDEWCQEMDALDDEGEYVPCTSLEHYDDAKQYLTPRVLTDAEQDVSDLPLFAASA